MTSSSSLYGTVTTQSTNSGNSTSLYGEAGTPIPDSSGNVVVRGDLLVLSGNILTTAATGNIFPTNATTINLGNAATTVNIGSGSGTTTINNALTVGSTVTAPGADFGNITIAVADNNTITTTTGALKLSSTTNTIGLIGADTLYTDTTGTFLLLNAPTTIYAFDSATTLELGDVTGTTTVRNNLVAGGSVTADSGDFANITIGVTDNQTIDTTAGELRLSSTSNAIKLVGTTSVYTDNTSAFNLLNQPTTVNAFLAATTLNIGADTGETNINNDLLVEGIGTFTGDITAPGADLGNIQIAITDNQTIDTTTGELRLGSVSNAIKLVGTTSIYTDNTGSFGLLNQPTTVNAFLSATALNLGATTGTTNVNNDLTIDGTTVSLAQNTTIAYSENNDRLNRPTVKSTTGNTSGLRVEAPNTGSSAAAIISAANSSDPLNSKFININARGSAVTNDLRIQTGKYTAGVLGASGSVVSFVDNITTYATVNPAGPTDPLDLTTKAYVDALPANITYTIDASSTTGGANFNLVGSDATTDTIKFSGSGATTVAQTSANEITISSTDNNTTYTQDVSSTTGGANLNLVGSDSTTDSVKFAGGTNVTVTATDASTMTISATDTNTTYDFAATSTTGGANLNLTGSDSTTDTVKLSNGTGVTVSQVSGTEVSVAIGQAVGTTADVTFNTVNANITDDNYVLGQLIATRNTAYVPPSSPLTTLAGQNGLVIASSSGGLGYGANIAIRYHTGDTAATGFNAASVVTSTATGTNSAPAGATTNLVMGAYNFDGYTAGTNNNYAATIATTNQGAGTNAISPLQFQGYVRQNFTNSTTLTTAVTGASGTGTTATLTFTLQNTAPYAVGQTVTIAGMTPSGYNGTYTITAATTSSISYANTTTGFTSGGTIAAANTVTAAGTGYRIRGFANSTNMTTGNRFNFIDHTASAATYKSDAYTFANSVITGSTLTATNYMTLGATVGSINQDTFTLKNTAGTTTYATANSTSVTLNGDTVSLRNTAGTTTYGNFTSTGTTITGAGLSTITRTTVGTPGSPESRPSMNIQLTRSDQAAPNDADNTSFRTRVAGSNGTFYTISDIGSVYKTGGDNEFRVNLANGDQTTGSFSGLSVVSSKISETRIRAGTPSATPGASTVSDVAVFTPTTNTLRSDALTLTDYAGAALVGNKISYNRVYGQWQNLNTITPAAANTAYAFALPNTDFNNIATVASTSQITPGALGFYKTQFSVQVLNTDNAAEHTAYFWWRKNGTDIPGSMGRLTVPRGAVGGELIAGWDNMIQVTSLTDYWELMYAVEDVALTFPFYAATAFGPSTASLFLTLVPVGA